MPVWEKGYGTKAVDVGVLDGAIDTTHPELAGSECVEGFEPYEPNDSHGTNVAGLIAARDDGKGMIGIAPRAKIYGYGVYRDSAKPTTKATVPLYLVKALNSPEHKTIAVYNGSLGHGSEVIYFALLPALEKAMDTVTAQGFHGKGSSLVFSVGNDGLSGNTPNKGYLRHHAVIGVNSIFRDGHINKIKGHTFNFSSSRGVNVWITAPTFLVTTANGEGYNKSFGGTSAAAPLVSGAIALLRSEYPKLTWRDVKLILAESARKYDDKENALYQKSGIKHSDGKKQYHSRIMGFGLLDVAAAFELADAWHPLPTMETHTGTQGTPLANIQSNKKASSELTITGSGIDFIESVTLTMKIKKSTLSSNLELWYWSLRLISPEGIQGSIYDEIEVPFREGTRISGDIDTLTFVIHSFLGSKANGTWKLEIQQNHEDIINEITEWNLTFRGY